VAEYARTYADDKNAQQLERSSMENALSAQTTVVTGAGRGIGRAIALALAAQGARVACLARSRDEIDETVRLAGSRARAFAADVTDAGQVGNAFALVESELGPVDLLVNNAGLLQPIGPFADTDPMAWWRIQEVNLLGPALCSRAVLPMMIARRKGRIVTVASGAGANAMPPYFSGYVVSKTAALRFSECLAQEVKEQGISVFAVGPGTVRTDMSNFSAHSEAGRKWLPWFRAIFDEGRDVGPERAADLIVALALGKADSLSGRYVTVADDLDRLIEESSAIAAGEFRVLRARTS